MKASSVILGALTASTLLFLGAASGADATLSNVWSDRNCNHKYGQCEALKNSRRTNCLERYEPYCPLTFAQVTGALDETPPPPVVDVIDEPTDGQAFGGSNSDDSDHHDDHDDHADAPANGSSSAPDNAPTPSPAPGNDAPSSSDRINPPTPSPAPLPDPTPSPDHGSQHASGDQSLCSPSNHEHNSHQHHDAAMMAEHTALLDLVQRTNATHIAFKSGDWTNPGTWCGGSEPTDDSRVLIPETVRVVYDGTQTDAIDWLRIDGELSWSTSHNTYLKADTVVNSPTGVLTIGTKQTPVNIRATAIIEIADNGAIDVRKDPTLVSRGLISLGTAEIVGAKKTPYATLKADAKSGSKTLTFDGAIPGWVPGDRLAIHGTTLKRGGWQQPENDRQVYAQDEVVTIKSISGSSVTIDSGLRYDHVRPRSDLKIYVANLTRNIRIQTENGANLPPHKRGHVMFMHSPKVDVRYAEFRDLGRTDKSRRSLHDCGSSPSPSCNRQSRYPLHLHRIGVEDLGKPAMIVGNSVVGSPGWGYTHHDSNAIMTKNVAYGIYGAAFVAETGNETGRWSRNIAIKCFGVSNGAKHGPDREAFDFGRNGVAFWFQGRMVSSVENIGADCQHGFVYNSRTNGRNHIPVSMASLTTPEVTRYNTTDFIQNPALEMFRGNVSIANERCLEVFRVTPGQGHDKRTVLEDFTCWAAQSGLKLHYTSHYTMRDIDIICQRGTLQLDDTEGEGIGYGTNTADMVVIDTTIDGCAYGVRPGGAFVQEFKNWGITRQYFWINTKVTNSKIANFAGTSGDKFLDSEPASSLSFRSDVPQFTNGGGSLRLEGVKSDGLGSIQVWNQWEHPFDIWLYGRESLENAIALEGYWKRGNSNVTVYDQYVSDRLTGEPIKHGVFVTIPGGVPLNGTLHGNLNENAANASARNDTVSINQGGRVVIDVLANDANAVSVDGIQPAQYGVVADSGNGIIYIPDPEFTGVDTFDYWADNGHGKYDRATVTVTVR